MVHQHGIRRRLLLGRGAGRRRCGTGAVSAFRTRARTARVARRAARAAGATRARAGAGRGSASRRPRARLRRAAGSRGARRGTRPRRSRGASDLLSTGERRIHRRSRRCPGQRRNAQHAGARANAQSSRGIGRSGIGLRPFDRQGTHCARRVRRACLDLAHLAVEPQRRLKRDHHRAGLVAGNHGRDCGHVTADACNHQGERRGRKRHHGTGDAGLPPQPARAARRAVGRGERGRGARGRADGASIGRRPLSGRLRARNISGSQIRCVAGGRVRRIIDGRIRRIIDCQVCRIFGDQVRRVASRQIRRIALVVMRVLLRHRLPSFPRSSQKSPLCQAGPVLLAQSLVCGYCNRIA